MEAHHPPLSEYDMARLEQIARNEAKLSELGLLAARSLRAPRAAGEPAPKRPRLPRPARQPTEPARRSERALLAKAAEDARRERGEDASSALGSGGQATALARLSRDRGEPSGAGLGDGAATDREPPQTDSSRSQAADLEALERLGVGNEVPGPSTKASVMQLASRGRCPKFSKCVLALLRCVAAWSGALRTP